MSRLAAQHGTGQHSIPQIAGGLGAKGSAKLLATILEFGNSDGDSWLLLVLLLLVVLSLVLSLVLSSSSFASSSSSFASSSV